MSNEKDQRPAFTWLQGDVLAQRTLKPTSIGTLEEAHLEFAIVDGRGSIDRAIPGDEAYSYAFLALESGPARRLRTVCLKMAESIPALLAEALRTEFGEQRVEEVVQVFEDARAALALEAR